METVYMMFFMGLKICVPSSLCTKNLKKNFLNRKTFLKKLGFPAQFIVLCFGFIRHLVINNN